MANLPNANFIRYSDYMVDVAGWSAAPTDNGDNLTADTLMIPYNAAINRWEAGETVLSLGHQSTFFAAADREAFDSPSGNATLVQYTYPFVNPGYEYATVMYRWKLSPGNSSSICSLIYCEILSANKSTAIALTGAGQNSMCVTTNPAVYGTDFPVAVTVNPDQESSSNAIFAALPDYAGPNISVTNYLRITFGVATPGIRQYNNTTDDYKYGLKTLNLSLYGSTRF